MAKLKLKKPSKRQPARQRYKIQKKIRQHNRKIRKEAKKNPKSTKAKIIQVPNICPFKEDILKEVEAMKKQREDEKLQRKLEFQRLKTEEKQKTISKGLEGLVVNAEIRGKLHDNFADPSISTTEKTNNQEHSLKAYYKEFKKVISASDVILEIVDARDPLGTRCNQVEQAVRDLSGSKRLVVVLNKVDLVPRDNLNQWLKYLKRTVPAVPFKASTQDQSKRLGQRKFAKSDQLLQGSSSIGAEMLMSLLANYCRNKGIKTSITVGVVGMPNVGKSSIINSLKRSRACNVGAVPGVTRAMQVVQLDSKIKLLDSPGIVFAADSDNMASLRNSVRISTLLDPITPATAILQRVTKQQLMEMYNIGDFKSPDEFFHLKASRMGRFKRGGVPDVGAAARNLLEDWNSGKIKYCTVPPVTDAGSQISSKIVEEIGKEFDLETFEAMESEVLDKSSATGNIDEFSVVETLGQVMDVVVDDNDDDNDRISSPRKTAITNVVKIVKEGVPGSYNFDEDFDME